MENKTISKIAKREFGKNDLIFSFDEDGKFVGFAGRFKVSNFKQHIKKLIGEFA